MTTFRLPLVAAAAWIALAGCAGCGSAEISGNAVPGGSRDLPDGSVTPSTTARRLPPRPRDIDLGKVDPCRDVLTRDQLRQLAYDLGYQIAPEPGSSRLDDARTCTYSSSTPLDQPSRDIGSLVAISTTVGADAWLAEDRQNEANPARQTSVAGFPAVITPHPRFADSCSVVMDVHDGQYLQVVSNPSGGARGTSPDKYCAEAERVAGMAIQTLLAGK